jgi:alkylation response protein AidB-like acyl-CoA dehydrogenase
MPEPSAEQVRAEVRAWLVENWSPDRPRAEYFSALADSGWAGPTWPVEWCGRGLPRSMRGVVIEEFRSAGAPGGNQDVTNLFVNVALTFGSEALKQRWIRRFVSLEATGCLLYSEPGAGSDLAAVQTRAEKTGAGWTVNGQKVWTSGGHTAKVGLLLARTDWDVPKHRGLSFYCLEMDQPGVDVRPISQVTGGSHFNEVFLTDAFASDDDLLGEINGGWGVMQVALGYERQIMGGQSKSGQGGLRRPDPHSPFPRDVGGTDYVALAKASGHAGDASVRQEVARIWSLEQVNRWNSMRAQAERSQGADSPVASLGKLAMSRIHHDAAFLTSNLLGARSLLDGEADELAAEVNRSSFAAFVTSIGGGTDQVQRNIIGERILGLPKEPELDKDVPFRDVRKAEATRAFGR